MKNLIFVIAILVSFAARAEKGDILARVKADAQLLDRKYDDRTMSKLEFANEGRTPSKEANRLLIIADCARRPVSEIGKANSVKIQNEAVINFQKRKKTNSPPGITTAERIVICDNRFIFEDKETKAQYDRANQRYQQQFKPAGARGTR